MNNNTTGGAAFPTLERDTDGNGNSCLILSSEGMTLLDYFAAKAMQPMAIVLSNSNGSEYAGNDAVLSSTSYPALACYSYNIAAAMLEERKKYIK